MLIRQFGGLPQINMFQNSAIILNGETNLWKLKLQKSIFFVNSSLEAIVHLVQKALLACKIKQKLHLSISRILWHRVKIRPK